MARVVITVYDKCKSEALLYGYPWDWCEAIVPQADLSVYDGSGRIWYEEFDTVSRAIDALRLAIRERERSGWICREKKPARFADEVEAYECIHGDTRHILVVHKR